MKFYYIKSIQHLPVSLEEAWAFFSKPNNLAKFTPPEIGFKITSDMKDGENMYEGQIITYTLKPILGIKLKWMTEITHVKPLDYFVDEQRFGPYKMWHHRHVFIRTANGVEMQDHVNYIVPFGIIGRIAHKLFLKKQIEGIFAYRTKVLDEIFRK